MFGNGERAGPARRPEVTIFAVPLLVYFFGRIVRSAIARNVRAIFDGLAAQRQLRSLQQHLVLRGADLRFDDVKGEILLVATGESRSAIPNGDRARGGPWVLTIARPFMPIKRPERIQLSRRSRSASCRWTIDLLQHARGRTAWGAMLPPLSTHDKRQHGDSNGEYC